jgi:ABC-type oligopeptide transport system substrate-binding subunit
VNGTKARRAAQSRIYFSLAFALHIAVSLVLVLPGALGSPSKARQGGTVLVAYRGSDIDSLDPALAYTVAAALLLDPTCALLLRSGGPHGLQAGLQPEVAARLPRVSRDGKTYTFTIRRGFRFSDGSPVEASAFARAIYRTLAPGVKSPWAAYTHDIVGAEGVTAGKTSIPRGVTAKGNTLTIRLKRPIPDFPARTTFLCAVPPSLPADPEGIAAFHAAGPYYIAEYRPAERVVLRRNPFYGGKRRHYADGFTVDLRMSSYAEVLDRIERGEADWGWALAPFYFDPARRLAAKYGVNKSQFFVQAGAGFRGYAFNTSRPLFKDNVPLRRAVNFAIDRAAFRRAAGGPLSSRLTDQYLPPGMAGFRDARIYPLERPDLRRARALARGNTRSGKVVLYTIDAPHHIAFAQSIKQNLARIGLDVLIKDFPIAAYFGRLMARGPYDLGFATWTQDFADPYSVLNVQLDSQFIGATNWPRFDSSEYDRLLRRAARLQGRARYRAYGALDVRLAREAAPMVAIDHFTDPTLVSKRIGCIRNDSFHLASVCLK